MTAPDLDPKLNTISNFFNAGGDDDTSEAPEKAAMKPAAKSREIKVRSQFPQIMA